LRGGK